jgi:hypothetical protein
MPRPRRDEADHESVAAQRIDIIESASRIVAEF